MPITVAQRSAGHVFYCTVALRWPYARMGAVLTLAHPSIETIKNCHHWALSSILLDIFRALLVFSLFLAGVSFLVRPHQGLKVWYSRLNLRATVSANHVRKAAFILLGFVALLVADAVQSNWQARELRHVGPHINGLASAGAIRLRGVNWGPNTLKSALAALEPTAVLKAIAGSEAMQSLDAIHEMIKSMESHKVERQTDDGVSAENTLPYETYLDKIRSQIPMLGSRPPQGTRQPPPSVLGTLFSGLADLSSTMLSRKIQEQIAQNSELAVLAMSQTLEAYSTGFYADEVEEDGKKIQEFLATEERVRFGSTWVIVLLALANAVVGSYCIKTRRTRGLLCCCLAFTLLGGGLYLGQAYHVASGVASGAICDYMRSLPSQTTPMAQLNLTGQQVFSMIDQCSRGKDLVAAFHASGVKEIEFKSVKIIAEPTYLDFVTREKVKKSEGDVNGEADHSTGTTEEKIRRLEFDENGQANYSKFIRHLVLEKSIPMSFQILETLLYIVDGLNKKSQAFKHIPQLQAQISNRLQPLISTLQNPNPAVKRIRVLMIDAVEKPMTEWLKSTVQCKAMADQFVTAVETGCKASEGLQALILDLVLLTILVVLLTMCFFVYPRLCMDTRGHSIVASPKEDDVGDDASPMQEKKDDEP